MKIIRNIGRVFAAGGLAALLTFSGCGGKSETPENPRVTKGKQAYSIVTSSGGWDKKTYDLVIDDTKINVIDLDIFGNFSYKTEDLYVNVNCGNIVVNSNGRRVSDELVEEDAGKLADIIPEQIINPPEEVERVRRKLKNLVSPEYAEKPATQPASQAYNSK
jgi:hypothetical protein